MAMSTTQHNARLGKRLKLWAELFSQRPDIQIKALSIGPPAKLPSKGMPRPLHAILSACNGLQLAWAFPDSDRNDNQLHIRALDGAFALRQHQRGDGTFEEGGDATDFDARITGHYELDRPSIEVVVRLAELDGKKGLKCVFTDANYNVSGLLGMPLRYFTEGAKSAFILGWFARGNKDARAQLARLKAQSENHKSKKARRDALVGKGLSAADAEDLIVWLGAGVNLLLPKDSAG